MVSIKIIKKSATLSMLFLLNLISLFIAIDFTAANEVSIYGGAPATHAGSGINSNIYIEMQENKMVGLLRFIYSISGFNRGASIAMKAIYESKREDKSGDVEYIKKFKNLFKELPPAINIFGHETSPVELNEIRYQTPVVIQYMAAASSDEENFKFLISGVLHGKNLNEFIDCINYFMPIYEKIYYEPSVKAGFKKLVKEKNKCSPDFKNLLSRIYSFYDSSILEPHVKVILVPLYVSNEDYIRLKNSNCTLGGESDGNFQIVEVIIPAPPSSDKNYEWNIAIHEIVHFFQMNSNNIDMFNTEVINCDDEYGKICQKFLNEAIATAIQIHSTKPSEDSKTFKDEWYHSLIVDGFARRIYRNIAEYIDEGKPMDKELAVKITAAFKNKFKDAARMYEVLFFGLNVLTANYDSAACMQIIGSSLPCAYANLSKINDGETSVNKRDTNLFIIGKNEIESLAIFKNINIQKIKNNLKNSENFSCSFFNDKERKFDFVFVINDLKNLEPLLKKFDSKKLIEECVINL